MQLIKFLISALFFVVSIASCKNNEIAKADINTGKRWESKNIVSNDNYNSAYSFKIKAGGLMDLQEIKQQRTGRAIWKAVHNTAANENSFNSKNKQTFRTRYL